MKKYKLIQLSNDPAYGYGGYDGAFAMAILRDEDTVEQKLSFQKCRELFADYFNGETEYFLMFVRPDKHAAPDTIGKRVRAFMKVVEGRLKLSEEDRLEITKIPKIEMLTIKVSKWWRQNEVRRQFLTVMLRAALNYKENFDEALDSYGYSKNTRPAVDLFLDGYTMLTVACKMRSSLGWYSYFQYRTIEEVKKYLKKEGE